MLCAQAPGAMSLLSFLRVLSICVRCHWMLPAWGQRASGPHAIGRVAREGLRSPPGAPGKKSKGSKAEAMQKANQKTQSCYPRARVSHVIPGRACHMLSPGVDFFITDRRTDFACNLDYRVGVFTAMMMMMVMMLMMFMQMMMLIICVWHVTPGRPCHMLPWGACVICYPRASVSHVTLGGQL